MVSRWAASRYDHPITGHGDLRVLSQVEMSHAFGIDRGHISELEHGKRSPGLPMLETLASGFKITISELMRGV